MDLRLSGIHHVTSIAGDPQRNVDFYTGILGLRLVKQTVNFDVPGTYHLYYGDAVGTPGTILTTFPWAHLPRVRSGAGQISTTAFTIPAGSMGYWARRLRALQVPVEGPIERLGEQVLTFRDHDGLAYDLIERERALQSTPWERGPVPAEHAIRGFAGVTLLEPAPDRTARVLTETLGFTPSGEEGNRARFIVGDGPDAATIDVLVDPDAPPGTEGVGTVHHIAYRTPDDATQLAWRERAAAAGLRVTPVRDRQYFRSIYFREPGGVLFEIATAPPGFAVDESIEQLGSSLKLPPWLEPERERIERGLEPIRVRS